MNNVIISRSWLVIELVNYINQSVLSPVGNTCNDTKAISQSECSILCHL